MRLSDRAMVVVSEVETEAVMPDRLKVLQLFVFCSSAYEAGLRELGLVDTPGLMTMVGQQFVSLDKAVDERVGKPSGFQMGVTPAAKVEVPVEAEVGHPVAGQLVPTVKKTKVYTDGAGGFVNGGGRPVTEGGNAMPKTADECLVAHDEVERWLSHTPGQLVAQIPEDETWKFVRYFAIEDGRARTELGASIGVKPGSLDYWVSGKGSPKGPNWRKCAKWLQVRVTAWRKARGAVVAPVMPKTAAAKKASGKGASGATKSKMAQKNARAEVKVWLHAKDQEVSDVRQGDLWKFVNYFGVRVCAQRSLTHVQIAKEANVSAGSFKYWMAGRGNPIDANERKIRKWLKQEIAIARTNGTDTVAGRVPPGYQEAIPSFEI